MARLMSPEREKEYAELVGYIDFWATELRGIRRDDPIHPTNVGASIVERFGRSKALQGARQAANDTVEELRDRGLEYIRVLDEVLLARNLLTFSEVYRRYGRAYQRIVKRGKILNDTEFYIVSGVLSDLTLPMTNEERAELCRLSNAFEARIGR
jgi:hypothetical protein